MTQASEIPNEYYFITPPQDVSWSKGSRTSDVQTYATNNPYVNYGATQLRSLSLGNAMLEGFSDGKQVEWNVIDLEACMRVVLDTEDGYAAPFCWEVYAGGKSYGTFIIESVNVQEQIRDNSGMAARAMVDVSFKEVAPYQVNAGIDITAESITGNLSQETQEQLLTQSEANKQDDKVSKDKDKNKDKNKDKDKNSPGGGTTDSGDAGGTGGKGPDTVNGFWEEQYMKGGK